MEIDLLTRTIVTRKKKQIHNGFTVELFVGSKGYGAKILIGLLICFESNILYMCS